MTHGLTHLESDPDFIAAAEIDNFIERTPGDQCLNIPRIQRLALKIGRPLPPLSLPLSREFFTAILEKQLFYAQQ
jgi:hypothetical protein